MPDMLPSWSLDDLYEDFNSPRLQSDQDEVRQRASEMASRWKTCLHEADADQLAKVIEDYERIAETLGRMTSFADLAFAADMSDPEVGKQAQMMRELESEISAKLVFVELEIAAIDDKKMDSMMASPSMSYWAPWIKLCGRSESISFQMNLKQC